MLWIFLMVGLLAFALTILTPGMALVIYLALYAGMTMLFVLGSPGSFPSIMTYVLYLGMVLLFTLFYVYLMSKCFSHPNVKNYLATLPLLFSFKKVLMCMGMHVKFSKWATSDDSLMMNPLLEGIYLAGGILFSIFYLSTKLGPLYSASVRLNNMLKSMRGLFKWMSHFWVLVNNFNFALLKSVFSNKQNMNLTDSSAMRDGRKRKNPSLRSLAVNKYTLPPPRLLEPPLIFYFLFNFMMMMGVSLWISSFSWTENTPSTSSDTRVYTWSGKKTLEADSLSSTSSDTRVYTWSGKKTLEADSLSSTSSDAWADTLSGMEKLEAENPSSTSSDAWANESISMEKLEAENPSSTSSDAWADMLSGMEKLEAENPSSTSLYDWADMLSGKEED